MNRPLTQKEIKKQKQMDNRKDTISVHNITKRMVQLQIRDKNSDFYVGEQTIRINPGQSYANKESVFNESQLSNLKAKGEIRVSESI